MRKQAQNYVNENSVPKINYTLNANLEKITDIGDTVEVIYERLGINLFTNVIAYVYDCILEKYTEVEFGNFKNKLSKLVSNIAISTNKKVEQSTQLVQAALTSELQESTSEIFSMLSDRYVTFDGDKILVVDKLPKETAVNVMMINDSGIGLGNTGINGQFSWLLTIDRTLNLRAAKSVVLTDGLKQSAMTRSLHAPITNLAVKTYTIVPLDTNISTDGRLTATADGGVQIGPGVTRVLVSGQMTFAAAAAGNSHVKIVKNSYTEANILGWGQSPSQIGETKSIAIAP